MLKLAGNILDNTFFLCKIMFLLSRINIRKFDKTSWKMAAYSIICKKRLPELLLSFSGYHLKYHLLVTLVHPPPHLLVVTFLKERRTFTIFFVPYSELNNLYCRFVLFCLKMSGNMSLQKSSHKVKMMRRGKKMSWFYFILELHDKRNSKENVHMLKWGKSIII